MSGNSKQDVMRLLKRGLNHYGLGDLPAAIGSWEQALELDPGNRAASDYLETAYEETRNRPTAEMLAARQPVEQAEVADLDAGAPPTLEATLGGAPEPAIDAFSPREARESHEPVDDDDDTPRTVDGPASIVLPSSGEEPDTLVSEALRNYKEGRVEKAWEALRMAAEREPDRLDIQGYIAMMRSERARAFAREVGDQGRVLRLKRTMQELMGLNLSPDEGFMLSQIDGTVSIEQLLNLSTDRVRTLEVLAKFIREGVVE